MEIKVLHQVMDWNEDVSEEVKNTLASHHICMINLMGSPGAGKTSLISALIGKLKSTFRIGVIEGDPRRSAEYRRCLPHRGHEHPAHFT